MERQTDSAIVGRIVQIAFSLVLIGIGLFSVRRLMFGSSLVAKLTIVGLVGLAIIIALDKRFWILSAFLFGFYETIPGIKFTGAELGSIMLVGTLFVRQALHRDSRVIGFKGIVLAALPFMLWMCIVWTMNPTGMFIFGSSTIGGRFYFKVILAFLSMFCLSVMRFSENDCKLLGYSIGAGCLAYTVRLLVLANAEEALLGSEVHYRFIRMSFIAPLFLCRFSAPELLTRAWPFWGFLFSFGLSFYSGNRTAAARPVLVGLMAPFFLKKDKLKTFTLVVAAGVALSILILGHGSVWRLPFAIQRPLSFLPGRWDVRLESFGLKDDFRAELRYWARQHIHANPWFGDGGFSLNSVDMVWSNALSKRGGFSEDIAGHVMARNWHNVWLGMAADFGIPLSVAWGLFMLVLMVKGYNGTKRLPPGSWWQTMYLYCYLLVLTEFVNFFFNGGHTSETAQQLFLWAGLMMAILNGVPSQALVLNHFTDGQENPRAHRME